VKGKTESVAIFEVVGRTDAGSASAVVPNEPPAAREARV